MYSSGNSLLKGNLHIKLCLQVLGSITANVKKSCKEEAACNLMIKKKKKMK